MNDLLKELVRSRADGRCEYCRMPQHFEFLDFEFDHIIAQKHGGSATPDNLAFSCFHCNSHKGPNLAGFDPLTKRVIRLLNPRKDRWAKHLEWDGPLLIGRTSIGRVTVYVLNINDPDAVAFREIMLDDGLSP
jgi:hypothetical protein